ncbi:asparagine synthase (glutamine-hydrolyzing) [Altererythrobacter sp. BO-6]|uniref:asparagine synthase (glutamine-hydrolyzing) n=1 Tax=Altererythrobacter sp. BO-6 TaxID=2604537 RepID=UPI0013E12B0A|nr:asparagine synthase (glutamine-hydrolyzing) [Altererythrobacter sp. BO-6]QIG54264.1 asparagine synthase (glutamine-hydrolyzing) [Altererythrobacter sp. BO-6]
MCGIAGVYAPDVSPGHLDGAINRMIEAQRHRGPDSFGKFIDPALSCGLGHDRLSILDLSAAGHQPMSNEGELQVICYNGEVYNFDTLRAELEQSRSFLSHTDTEVILAAYERWGTRAFERLNGMFAFAILDRTRRKLILVRDRLGIKPLFYTESNGNFIFGSEIKTILASGLVGAEPNFGAMSEFIYFGNTLGTRTLYSNIRQLLPGHWISLDLASGELARPVPYWTVAGLPKWEEPIDEGSIVEKTKDLLDKAVQRQLHSDVPVGAFLSGGVDSSAIVALASRHYAGKLRTYTVGFDYIGSRNELPLAARVARHFNTDHHELHVAGDKIEETIERLAIAHDQPFADAANLPLFQLCEVLGGETKVILQGDGGDELFGGYRRYGYLGLPRVGRPLATLADWALGALSGHYGRRGFGAHRFFHALAQNDPAERMALLLSVEGPLSPPHRVFSPGLRHIIEAQDPFERYREVAEALPRLDDLQLMLHTDLQILLPDIFLQKVDRSTMAMSTEVRVPFLDFDLVDYVATVPARTKIGLKCRKKLLRKVLKGIVPQEVLDAPKSGFGVPIRDWLAGPLRSFAESRILAHAGPVGWFDGAVVRNLFNEHSTGRRDHSQILWKALQLALWRENSRFEMVAP